MGIHSSQFVMGFKTIARLIQSSKIISNDLCMPLYSSCTHHSVLLVELGSHDLLPLFIFMNLIFVTTIIYLVFEVLLRESIDLFIGWQYYDGLKVDQIACHCVSSYGHDYVDLLAKCLNYWEQVVAFADA